MPSLPREDAPTRRRYLACAILFELLYRPAEPEAGFERLQDGSVLMSTAAAKRLFKLGATRFLEQLARLQLDGYLDILDHRHKFGLIRVRAAKPIMQFPTEGAT